MTREQIFSLIRAHLADELEVDPDSIEESTRFREDLEADSLDLYTLVQELEDSYGVKISDEEAARILTVGQAVEFVLASGAAGARSRRPRAKAPTLSEREPRDRHAGRGPPARRCASCWTSCRPSLPRGVHPRLLDDQALGLLRAAGLPGRQRAGAGGHLAPLPAAGGRALRRRAADQDPRPGGLGPLVPGGRRAARGAGAAAAAAPPAAARASRHWSRPSGCWPR